MGKFLLGVLIGIVVTVVGTLVVVFAFGRLFANNQPIVAANSVLVLSLQGDVPEASPLDVSFPFFNREGSPTVRDLWTSLRNAATDHRIKAVVIQPSGLSAGWGKLQEIRQELIDFKRSGKPVYAYLQSAGSREYYLATIADKIYLSPDDMLDIKGFRLEELYFKNTLDKAGIGVQVDHIGRYKDAGDIFTKTSMSPDTRDVLNQVLDQIYGEFCSTVGQSRHKTTDDVKTLLDMGPFMASQAKASNLIDELGYEDQVYADLKKKTGGQLNKTSIKRYFRAVPGSGDRIAMLVGEGDIVRGNSGDSNESQGNISSGSFSRAIQQVRNDKSVKGVILRIDSPGGDSVASDEILHELKLLSSAKPLVVSMSDVAASGGYFMAMTGDKVISYPNTITGSVGVLYVRPNFRGLFDRLGITSDAVSRGRLADLDSVDTPLSDAAKVKLHESIETTYKSFVSKVAGARRKSYDQIDSLAQGRVWMGAQALQNGLVDQLGGLDQAVALVRNKAKLPPTGDTNLVMFPPRRSLFEMITNSASENPFESAARDRLRTMVPAIPGSTFVRGGMLKMLPLKFSVQ